jgi:RHS repeat-associated protein
VPYTWDDNGNLSAGSGQALLSDGVRTFEYDYANRLIRVVSGTLTTEYTYNGNGLRVGQTLNGQGTTFTWDVAAALPQVLATSDGVAYLYGLGLLAQQQSGAWQYPLADGLGSLRQWTDVGGQVTYAARYAPFGSLLWQQGTAPGPWGFAGEMQDPTGLIYLRARWYDPATGRFLTRDPFPGLVTLPSTQHPYVYVGNNPVNLVDPSGNIAPILLAIGVGAAIGGVGGGVGYALAHPGGRPEDYLRDAGFQRAVGVGALSGAVAGGVGFGVGGLVAGLPGLGGAVLGGALTGAAASGVGQVTTNLMTPCVKWNTGLGGAMFWGGVTGGIAGGVGWKIRQIARAISIARVTAELEQRAQQIHSALDPIAQSRRTTAVLQTDAGRIVASGVRDLTPAQRALLGSGEIAARLPGAHAEVTALQTARQIGAIPEAMAVTRTICPQCAAMIEASGGTLTSPTTVIWFGLR